jgi:hypothetical protein
MHRLSSRWTVFYKRFLPLLWVALLAVFGYFAWVNLRQPHDNPGSWVLLLMPLVMVLVFAAVYRWMIWDLADEVWLDGEVLRIVKGGEEARITLADVVNVNCTLLTNPRRITLALRNECRFGPRVSFIPASVPRLLGAFRPDPVATDLIQRVDAARRAAQ